MSLNLSEQEIVRRQAMQSLRDMGIEPYPAAEFVTTHHARDIKDNFDTLDGAEVVLAGRMMSRRIMGKASFAELMDSSGRIQIYVSRDDLPEGEKMYNTVFKKLLDIGDFIGVKGKVFRTQMGEISVHVNELTVLKIAQTASGGKKRQGRQRLRRIFRPGTALPTALRGPDSQRRCKGRFHKAH